MFRYAMNELIEWKNDKDRLPLIIQGARQVGKTWLMKEFGRTQFKSFAYINFDKNPRMKELFDGDINTERIITAFSIESGVKINPDKTLIILDEIQEVPEAIHSLKYFAEDEKHSYYIVAAGSLLGILLHSGTSFPVGKVSSLQLYPLTFREYLLATDKENLVDLLNTKDYSMICNFRDLYIESIKKYYYVGGMPAAVNTFVRTNKLEKVRKIQNELLNSYRQDFSKHSPDTLVSRLNMVWAGIPAQLAKENKKFIYSILRKGARAKEFETAIQWLADCGLIHKVNRVKKAGLPLESYIDLNSFKIFFNDVGLLTAMSDLDAKTILDGNSIFTEFKGALTEQFVCQQLISDCKIKPYYWSADNSMAEIDFIFQNEGKIIPVEVKAEENLKAKSLRIFLEKYNFSRGFRTSMSNYRDDGWVVNIPLYMCFLLNEV